MGKAKKIFTNWKVLMLLFFLVLAVWTINPQPNSKGLSIISVDPNSSASDAGITPPPEGTLPISRERVLMVNNYAVLTAADYDSAISALEPEQVVHVKTDKDTYSLLTRALTNTIITNETEWVNITEEEFDEDLNKTINISKRVLQNKTITEVIGVEDIGLKVDVAPKSNIRTGIDLRGGVRFKFKPEQPLNEDEFSLLMDNMKQRLNVFGLSDISVRKAEDLPEYLGGSGLSYIVVETSTANEEAIDTLKKQGKFEATVGNHTVFTGGEDITSVCRSAQCSMIRQCGQVSAEQFVCTFQFSITLSPEAAQRQADATADLDVVPGENSNYLSEQIHFFLDGEEVDALNIAADLKGKPATDIAISGSGTGQTQDLAIQDANKNMHNLQTLLITGSLPVKLIVSERTVIPPSVGEEFGPNVVNVGLAAMLSVIVLIFILYRKWKIALPMAFIVVSEVLLLFGFAAFIRQTIDLAAIAGLVVMMGTGVDHLVIITDATLKGGMQAYDWKKKLKSAFSIIIVAFFTTAVAMIPLISAGAGVLRGFGIVTIVGITVGVLIARPAYAAIIEVLLKD